MSIKAWVRVFMDSDARQIAAVVRLMIFVLRSLVSQIAVGTRQPEFLYQFRSESPYR
jgi:hypothetical protein